MVVQYSWGSTSTFNPTWSLILLVETNIVAMFHSFSLQIVCGSLPFIKFTDNFFEECELQFYHPLNHMNFLFYFPRNHSIIWYKTKCEVSSPGRSLKIRRGLSSDRNPGRVVGNGRLMVRNLERSSSSTVKVTSLDSLRPRRPMADGCLLGKSNSIGGVRVNPVLNVPACIGIGYVGGSWNGGDSLFVFCGLFSKRDKKHPSTYDHHYHT